MNKFVGHLKIVLHHKKLVFLNCVKAGIPFRGFFHDISKFSPTEFINGVKYFSDGKRSPTVAERKDKGYSAAWLHHKGRNRHHFEYWTELNWNGQEIYVSPMPLVFVKEMFCDRLAATETYLKGRYTDLAPLEYYFAKNERRFLHDKTAEILERALLTLATDGKDAALSYLKSLK